MASLFIVGLVVGLLAGTLVGVLAIALAVAAGRSDAELEREGSVGVWGCGGEE